MTTSLDKGELFKDLILAGTGTAPVFARTVVEDLLIGEFGWLVLGVVEFTLCNVGVLSLVSAVAESSSAFDPLERKMWIGTTSWGAIEMECLFERTG